MTNAERDNLIDAFLAGELDDAGRLKLADLLESDADTQRAFDDALHVQALLSAAHTSPDSVRRAISKIKARMNAEAATPPRASRSSTSQRPSLVKRSVRTQPITKLPRPSPINAWTALAASILILFGLAFYFIYDPSTPSVSNQNPSIAKNGKREYTVASGKVSIDGKDVREFGENEWLAVPKTGSVKLNAKDGTAITLESGSRALLRKRGATLSQGSGRFGVTSGDAPFILQTPVGTVTSSSGEFEARLDNAVLPNGSSNNALHAMTVTVASGTVDVDCAGKITQLNQVGSTRRFVENNASEKIADKTPAPLSEFKLTPPEQRVAETILDNEKRLSLSADQKKQLFDMIERFKSINAIMDKDSKIKGMVSNLREAEKLHDDDAVHRIKVRIRKSAEDLMGADARVGNPMDVLTEDQRRSMDPFVREFLREMHAPPPGRGEGDGIRPPPRPFPPQHPPGQRD
ncbi:MAG: hypothetical protein WCT04_10925 [Planctomycetota bacterium]